MRGRAPIRLTDRERKIIIFWYANPDYTTHALAAELCTCPGEVSRLLRLQQGRELINSLVQKFAPPDLWPDYCLPRRGRISNTFVGPHWLMKCS
jgi:hypothetical protein